MLRKFFSATTGMPTSPAKHVVRKVFPVPTGPQMTYPIGSTSVRPERSAAAASRSFFLAASCPATIERSNRLSINSSRPPASASIRSFLRARRNLRVRGCRFSAAWDIMFWIWMRFSPAVSLASVESVTSESAARGWAESCARINSRRPSSSGSGTAIEPTPGLCTMPWFSSLRFSETRQMVRSARRKAGFWAQRFRMTSELRSSAGIPETSPAGAMVSAKSITRAIFLPSSSRTRR